MSIALTGRARGTAQWQDVSARLPLPAGPFPLPFPDGSLTVDVLVHVDSSGAVPAAFDIPPDLLTGTPTAFLMLVAEYAIPPALDFGLPGIHPGSTCRIVFVAAYQNEAAARTALDGGGALSGALRFETAVRLDALRLPDELDWIQLRLGDEQGWASLRLTARADTNGAMSIQADIRNLGGLSVWMPALPSPEPAVEVWLSALTGTLGWDGSKAQGTLALTGGFRFRPRLDGLDVPIAPFLDQILGDVDLQGEVTGEIDLSAQEVRLIGTFVNAGVDIDLFEMFQAVARGSAGTTAPSASALPTFGFHLARIAMTLSRTPVFSIQMVANVGGFEVPAYLTVSLAEVSFGLGWADGLRPAFSIPFVLPQIRREDLEPVLHEFRVGLVESCRRTGATAAERDAATDRYDLSARIVLDAVELLSGVLDGGPGRLTAEEQNGEWHFSPDLPPPSGDELPIRIAVGGTGTPREIVVAAWVDDGWTLLLARPRLELKDISIKIPIRSPRDIQVGGAAHIVAEGPLSVLKDVGLRLALSTDMIYFSIETPAGSPAVIPVPELVPGYGPGEISIGNFLIGFSYTRRSLAMAFAGGYKLPPRLVDDLDTSEYGAGIRLPVHAQVMFRFDVMALTIGQVVVPIPMLQFNFDFRRNASSALLDASVCAPAWDGLQVIVKDQVRLGLKRLSYSMMFGCYCCSNSDFAGAISVGTPENGFAAVVENGFWAYGLDSGAAMMFAPIMGLPFADNACLHVGLAGFGLNLNIQRPVPAPSPFTIFELVALLSDPLHYEIAPRGELADTVRFSITDAWIDLPEPVQNLFPAVRGALHQPLELTINLGTFIKMLQVLGQAASPVMARGLESAQALLRQPPPDPAQFVGDALAGLAAIDVRKQVGQLLAALPPATRTVSLNGSLGPFAASVVIVLADMKEAMAGLGQPAAGDWEPATAIRGDMAWDPEAMATIQPAFKSAFDAVAPMFPMSGAPLLPERFAHFAAADLGAAMPLTIAGVPVAGLPLPGAAPGAGSATGVLIAADVRVLHGQEYSFVGRLSGDGRFDLVSSLDIAPLQIGIAGITVPFPLTLTARLALHGRRTAVGAEARVVAEASGTWQIASHVSLQLGEYDKERRLTPVRVEIGGANGFRISGVGSLTLWMVEINGKVDVGPGHCLVSGQLSYVSPSLYPTGTVPLELAMKATAEIGPGRRWAVDAVGFLTLLGQRCAGARVRITESMASVEGRFSAQQLKLVEGLKCDVNLMLRGTIDLRLRADANPVFALEGEGDIRWGVLGGVRIDGAASFRSPGNGDLVVAARGKMVWNGREWWNASVTATPTSVRVDGHTTISLAIEPIANANTGALVVQLEMGGAFSFAVNAGGVGLTTLRLRGGFMVGVRLPGANSRVTPVAQGSFESPDNAVDFTLMQVTGLPTLAAPTVTLPAVILEEGGAELASTVVRRHPDNSVAVRGIRIKWGDNTILDTGGSKENSVKVPTGAHLSETVKTVTVPMLADNFAVKLGWNDNRLQLKVGATWIPLGS